MEKENLAKRELKYIKDIDLKYVYDFINEVYNLVYVNEDMELNDYGRSLEKMVLNGYDSMKYADVCLADEQCVMALIMVAIHAEKFCDGALLDFFNNGCIKKWPNKLKEIGDK